MTDNSAQKKGLGAYTPHYLSQALNIPETRKGAYSGKRFPFNKLREYCLPKS